MNAMPNHKNRSRLARRSCCAAGAVLALLILTLPLAGGCDDAVATEFRAAAIDGIHTGLSKIIDGVLDGLFAIAEPDTDSDATTESSSGGSSGS